MISFAGLQWARSKGPRLLRAEQIRAWLVLRLRDLSQGLQNNLGELSGEGHHLADLEELAGDVSVEDVVFEQFRSSTDTIAQIEKAIHRLDDGTYPECEECGGGIGDERLEALPFATQCIDCKRSEEQSLSSNPE